MHNSIDPNAVSNSSRDASRHGAKARVDRWFERKQTMEGLDTGSGMWRDLELKRGTHQRDSVLECGGPPPLWRC
jgi:hypothetical protein